MVLLIGSGFTSLVPKRSKRLNEAVQTGLPDLRALLTTMMTQWITKTKWTYGQTGNSAGLPAFIKGMQKHFILISKSRAAAKVKEL